MQNIVLVIHLILALCLISIVLLQRSEGGGLGIGGGGGGANSGRPKATPMSKVTWLFAAGFIVTSLTLTVLAQREAAGSSVFDGLTPSAVEAPADPASPLGDNLLPPAVDDGPTAPPPVE